MAIIILPSNSFQLIALGGKMVAGQTALGAELKLTLITTAQMQSNLNAFITQDTLFSTQRSLLNTANGGWIATQGAVYDWLLAVSRMLTGKFGTRWNPQWAQAGFINPTTAIPTKIEARLGLALALVHFFTAQPAYEVAVLQLTAAEGTRLRNAALAAQQTVTLATVAKNATGVTWQTAFETLTAGMRDLIRNLSSVLGKSDPRWLQFGLPMPSTKLTPGQPQNLTLTLDINGGLLASCEPNALTTRFRWRMLRVGVDLSYQRVASTTEPMAMIPGVRPGQMVQVIVQAVSGPRQGVASVPVVFTMPLGADAPAKPAPSAPLVSEEESAAVIPRTNGHGKTNGLSNGNGHGPARL